MAKSRALPTGRSGSARRIGPMPRFHFDVHDSAERQGRESLDLPDLEAARDKARSLAVV